MVPVSESNGFFTHFLPLAAHCKRALGKKFRGPPGIPPVGNPTVRLALVVAEVLPEELLLVGPEAAAGRRGALGRFALLLALE
jgi:hypothetical protein